MSYLIAGDQAMTDAICNLATRVLVDNSIYDHCCIDDVVVRPYKSMLGGVEQWIRLARVEPRSFQADWKADQIEALRLVGDLARSGELQLCTSDELMQEHWNSFESIRTGQTGTEFFRDIQFEHLPSPVVRARYFQSNFERFISTAARLEFVQWLRVWGPKLLERGADLTSFEQESLSEVGRYVELCGSLPPGDGKLIDIFHLWTAERSGVEYFMTFDLKFANYLTQTSRANLLCLPLTPARLLEVLGHTFD